MLEKYLNISQMNAVQKYDSNLILTTHFVWTTVALISKYSPIMSLMIAKQCLIVD